MLRRNLAKVDPYIVAALLLALIAALPLLTRFSLPRHTDLELHVFRAAEFQSVLAENLFTYPRWAPDFYYGYGYPIFNYYAPLTYLLVSAFSIGWGVVTGMKIALVLIFVSASLGTYFLARQHVNPNAALVSSAAYIFSPYMLFIDPIMRGDAAEFLALGILPWLFWSFDRPLTTSRDVARASIVLALFVFSHNLMALIGAGLLALWLLWRGLFVDGMRRWPRDLAAIALAVALTAIFWLPFILERDAVRLDVIGPGHFDFRNHFVSLSTLLRPSPALDLGATTPHFIYNIGCTQWLFAIPALFVLRKGSRNIVRVALFFILASLLLIFLITPASRFVWEAIVPMAYVQFPWRLLGPAALMLSICVGFAASMLPKVWHRLHIEVMSSVALLAVLSFALPTMYPPAWEDFGDPGSRGSIEFELSGVALGTTSTGDFLPRSVTQLPPPRDVLIDAYRNGRVIDRFDYEGLVDAQITPERLNALDAQYAVQSDSAFTARFFIFEFPGWQAYVDGRPVQTRAMPGEGLIEFDVPASARSIGVRFESTPPRTTGMLISIVALVIMGALLIRVSRVEVSRAQGSSVMRHESLTKQYVIPLALIGFLLVKMIVFDNCTTCFRYTSPPQQAYAATNNQVANFGGHIALLGFDVPQPEVQPGESLPLTLYWTATAPVPINYQVFAQLTRPAVVLWGQSDKLNPGDFPSTRWPLDKYVWDDHQLRVLPGTPPGEYTLSVGLYTLADGRRAPVFDTAGNLIGDSVQLSVPIRVVRASQPPPIESLDIQTPLDLRAGDVDLLGVSIEQSVLPKPNFARVTLFWQALRDAPAASMVRVVWIDAAGEVANTIERAPGDAYPSSLWQNGEVVRDVFAFWLPPEFESGQYRVYVQLLDGNEQLIEIGSFEVTE